MSYHRHKNRRFAEETSSNYSDEGGEGSEVLEGVEKTIRDNTNQKEQGKVLKYK